MTPLGLVLVSSALLAGLCAAGPQVLRVTTIKEEPYAMSKGSELEGFCIDLLSAVSKKLDFKYDIKLVKDGRYGTTDDSGNWNGMIGEVVRGEADIAVAPLTLTAKRETAVDMTKPFMQTGLSFILRKDLASDDSQFLSLLTLFSTEMWMGVLVAYLLTSIFIFYLLTYMECNSCNALLKLKVLQDAIEETFNLNGSIKNLSHFFFTKGSLWRKKNSNNPTYHRIYEHIKKAQSYSLNAEEGFRKAQKGNYAFIGESVSLDLAVARYCNLTRAPEIIGMRGYSIAAPLGSPLVKNLSVAILQLSESGELDYFRSKWWASSCVAKNGKSAPLKPTSLKGIFLLLALGLGLGLFLALMELAAKSRKTANTQQKSCCSVMSAELSQRFRGGEAMTPESSEKSKA
uniref:Si:ch211-251b21.1 n=1 Tax=Cyprinus carpio TaxID=7962 RepID=A0A8C1WLA9_CYPCA